MTIPYLDTDVIVRLLTGDDPEKRVAATALFQQIEKGDLTVAAPDTVIADAVYVLSSPRIYHLPRAQVAALLAPLVRLPHFHVQNRRAVLDALHLYGTMGGFDFGDAMLIASMQHENSQTIYSYDRHFNRIAGIRRLEP